MVLSFDSKLVLVIVRLCALCSKRDLVCTPVISSNGDSLWSITPSSNKTSFISVHWPSLNFGLCIFLSKLLPYPLLRFRKC